MALEQGWAYVVGSEASGPKGSIQIAGADTNLDHDSRLVWSDDEDALVVSGNIIAKNFQIQSQTTTVVHLDVTGSSKFGDTPDDEHQFTGSVSLTGDLDVVGDITAGNIYGNGSNLIGVAVNTYETQEVNHLILGGGQKAIKTESNLSYENDTLYVTGAVQTDELSSSLAYFDLTDTEELTSTQTTSTYLTSSNMRAGDIILTGRIVDVNGKVILDAGTGETQENISITQAGGTTSISSTSFTATENSSIAGFEYMIVEEGLEVGIRDLVVKNDRVGIGTGVPSRRLEVFDDLNSQLRLSHAATLQPGTFLPTFLERHTDIGTDSDGNFHILPTNNRVGINTTSPNYSLDVQGDVGISGDLYVTGTLHARTTDFIVSADTVVLGDEATDTVTINASTMSAPNGLTIANEVFINEDTVGIGATSPEAKLMVESASNQFKVGTQTNKLSINVSNNSTMLSANLGTLDIANSTKVFGELRVGSSDDIILTDVGTVSSSVSVSSDLGIFNNLETNTITNGATIIASGSVSTPILNATNVNASTIVGQIQTPQQPNITQVGSLDFLNVSGDTSVANRLNVGSSLAVGTSTADRKVEIKDSNPQLRLTNTEEVFGISSHTYADIHVEDDGDLHLIPSSGIVKIPSLNLSNVPQGSSSNFLSLDANGNVILSPAVQSGIEVRNRVIVSDDYQVSTADYFIGIQAQSDLVVTLPDASTLLNGQIMVFKDESETADQHLIQVVAQPNQLIENRSSLTLASAGTSVNIYTDGQSKFFIM